MDLEKYIQQIDWQIVRQISFYVFAAITILGAAILLFTKNVLYGAYSLLVAFLGVAGIYVFAGADFIAVTQIMVYVGGILVLLIFGIMLTRKQKTSTDNRILVGHKNRFGAFIVAIPVLTAYLWVIFNANFNILSKNTSGGASVKKIGISLMTNYVFAFEVIGILLLVALVGASYIALKEKKV
ncbi:MAG: NADH-quinone oxidoreductase subunit J [Spirosomaceae bacterium]|nr:NADH-quinone oxidoreductase subunit J [Spirosomataceae bacterium]